jgi:hypothetical protein
MSARGAGMTLGPFLEALLACDLPPAELAAEIKTKLCHFRSTSQDLRPATFGDAMRPRSGPPLAWILLPSWSPGVRRQRLDADELS